MLGSFASRVMPFGLVNASGTFSDLMISIFRDLMGGAGSGIIVYLDDDLVYAAEHDSHIPVIREVLQRLRDVQLSASLDKWSFINPPGVYVGHVIF